MVMRLGKIIDDFLEIYEEYDDMEIVYVDGGNEEKIEVIDDVEMVKLEHWFLTRNKSGKLRIIISGVDLKGKGIL